VTAIDNLGDVIGIQAIGWRTLITSHRTVAPLTTPTIARHNSKAPSFVFNGLINIILDLGGRLGQ